MGPLDPSSFAATESDPEFQQAHIAAKTFLDAVRIDPHLVVPQFHMDRAVAEGWHSVVFHLHNVELERSRVLGRPPTITIHSLRTVAKASGDVALMAKALASAVVYGNEADAYQALDDRLARSVVYLDSGQGSRLNRPGAYIMCGLAFGRSGLWCLHDEMNRRAIDALAVPVPEAYAGLVDRYRVTATLNRISAHLAMAGQRFELDKFDELGDLFSSCPTFPEDLGLAFAASQLEAATKHDLIAALANRDPLPQTPTLDQLETAGLGGAVVGAHMMSQAIRRFHQGDGAGAADLAREAAGRMPAQTDDGLRSLALGVASRRPPVLEGARKYALMLAREREEGRVHGVRAVQARREAEALLMNRNEMATMAYTDSLTGLANRRHYDSFVQACRSDRSGLSIGVIVGDLNLFKQVNDTLGHTVGDQMLIKMGSLLRSSARDYDLAARTGGDEFVVILKGVTAAVTSKRCEDIERRTRELDWATLSEGLTMTISVGHATGRIDKVDDLLAQADAVMYANKEARYRRSGPVVGVC